VYRPGRRRSGHGKCPSASTKSGGKTAGAELACTAKDIAKPDRAGCSSGNDAKLSAVLIMQGPARPQHASPTSTTAVTRSSAAGFAADDHHDVDQHDVDDRSVGLRNGVVDVGETRDATDRRRAMRDTDHPDRQLPQDLCHRVMQRRCSDRRPSPSTSRRCPVPQVFGLTIFVNIPMQGRPPG
jgi:hypothetical protein